MSVVTAFTLSERPRRKAVLRVRAAGEKKCVVTIAGVNLTFDIFRAGDAPKIAFRR